MVQCKNCNTRVVLTADNVCPACRFDYDLDAIPEMPPPEKPPDRVKVKRPLPVRKTVGESDQIHVRRGWAAGFFLGLAGFLGTAVVIGALTSDYGQDLHSNLAWWLTYAFPGIVVIPMLLFFAGLSTYAPHIYCGFAKTLAILAFTSLPVAVFLGRMGMAHPRSKFTEQPPMYLSEILMFLIPMSAVSLTLIACRRNARRRTGTDETGGKGGHH
jgi:hypothetical protein